MRKGKNERVYFCKLCSYVATSLEDLDFHYRMSHEEDVSDDFITDDDVW